MNPDVAGARRDWEDGYRRLLEASADPAAAEPLHRQLDTVTDELRRRVGATYTMSELADVYATSERWMRPSIGDRTTAVAAGQLADVEDAAFHLYSRGAVDYAP